MDEGLTKEQSMDKEVLTKEQSMDKEVSNKTFNNDIQKIT